eukprot:3430774-Amphidinium_carterae.1
MTNCGVASALVYEVPSGSTCFRTINIHVQSSNRSAVLQGTCCRCIRSLAAFKDAEEERT